MILIDRRIGSGELLRLFPKGMALRCDLEFGDFAFYGNGPRGTLSIGIERKRLTDLLSSIRSGRLSGHQLPGLLKTYDIVYLIVEGIYRPAERDGVLEVPGFEAPGCKARTFGGKRKRVRRARGHGMSWRPAMLGTQTFLYSEPDGYLNTMSMVGVIEKRSFSERETVARVVNLHSWWSKPWEKHRAHLAFYEPPRPGPLALVAPTQVQIWAKDLPGVGWERSLVVAKHFRSVREMVNADREEWESVKGIGKTLAERIVEALGGAQ